MHGREEAWTDVYSDHTFTAGFASSRQISCAEDAVRGGPTQCTLSGGGCHLNLGESAEVQLRSLLWSREWGKPTWDASVNFISKTLQN